MAVRIYGNREIKTLSGEATRPTSAKVREALFNIWQGRMVNCRWLDLCAGSGAMGAEALCRGAQLVVGIERSGAACRIIEQNWQKVAKPGQTFEVIKGDVLRQIRSNLCAGSYQPFDCIYFDPPYAAGLYQPVLDHIANCLSPEGELAVEYSEACWQPSRLPETLMLLKEKRYGSTHLAFLGRHAG